MRKIRFAAAMPPQPPVIRIFLIFAFVTFCILFSAVWFSSCDNSFESPPFVLSQPECVLSSQSGNFQFAGVKFSVWNMRQSEIKSISAVFSVFESENGSSPFSGGNPFTGGNVITASLDCSILPGGHEEFEAGLDPYISKVPEKPFFELLPKVKLDTGT